MCYGFMVSELVSSSWVVEGPCAAWQHGWGFEGSGKRGAGDDVVGGAVAA